MTKLNHMVKLLLALLLMAGLTTFTFAWLTDSGMDAEMSVRMKVHKSYFESGDGHAPTQTMLDARDADGRYSEQYNDGPFEIKYPVQLYYLAWLQELGYFNLDEDEDGVIDPVYFYVSQDLDMTGFVLPPIGTGKFEFVGNFNGQGYKISNLTVANNNGGLTDSPENTTGILDNAEIVGFFGVVGSVGTAGEGVHACDPVTGVQLAETYSYNSSVNEVTDFILENVTVKAESTNSLAGIVAGYVNGKVENVKVCNTNSGTSTIEFVSGTKALSGITGNLSDHTLFGYVADGFDTSDVVVVQLDTPTAASSQYNYSASGSSAGFGGSIGMDELYKRIDTLRSSPLKTAYRYQSGEFHYFHNGVEDLSKYTTTNSAEQNSYEYFDPNNPLIGRVIYGQTQANYLWGVRSYTGNYTTTNEYHKDVDYYYISNGNNYLRFQNGTPSSSTQANRTLLYRDETTGEIYYLNGNTKYYLYVDSSNLSLKASTANSDYRFHLDGNATSGFSMKATLPSSISIPLDRYVSYSNSAFNVAGSSSYTLTNENNGRYSLNNDGWFTTYYLQITNGNAGRTNTEGNRTIFSVDSDGYVYYTYNGAQRYLYANSTTDTTIRSSTTKQTFMFKVNDNKLRLYFAGGDVYVGVGSLSATAVTATRVLDEVTTDTNTERRTFYTHGTYLPVNVYKDASEITTEMQNLLDENNPTLSLDLVANGAKINNPGYIIGGTKTQTDQYGSAVRVASNYDYGDITRALGGSSSYSGSNLQILTRTKDSGGVVYIQDDYNSGTDLTDNQKSLGYITTESKSGTRYKYADDLSLKMYKNSRKNLDAQFNANTSNLYVMRFNEFAISMDHTITAEMVLLNGEIKTNYVFPESCIDFNLNQKGYINFFGGGFRGGNCNAFFSLFHIIRDASDNITALKHMSKIYGKSESDPYVYYYDDDRSYAVYDSETKTYQTLASLPSGYELYFDMNWVEAPGFTAVDNTMWYFEIPVNEGEYALGAVDGRTGAYMMYLDIGANAQQVDRATVTENFCETVKTYEYPTGATFVSDPSTALDTPVTPSVTGTVTAPGTVTVTVGSDDNTITESGMNKISYVRDGVTVNGTITQGEVPKTTVVTQIRRITYYDYNIAANRYTITEVEARKIGSGDTTFAVTAWDATYDETTGAWTKNGDPIYSSSAKPEDLDEHEADTANGIPAYSLLDITYGTDNQKQTLRFEDDAFQAISGTSNITEEKFSFYFAIDENDAKIIYLFKNLVTLNETVDPTKLYTLTDNGYDVEVQSGVTVTIKPDPLPSGLTVTTTTVSAA